jgi:hypothetical protein
VIAPEGSGLVRLVDGGLTHLGVMPYEPADSVGLNALAEETRLSGWTPAVVDRFAEALSLGASLATAAIAVEDERLSNVALAVSGPADPAEHLVETACIADSNSDIRVKQCVLRYEGADNGTDHWLGDTGYVYAQQRGATESNISMSSIQNQWNYTTATTQIADFNPKAVVPKGDCSTLTIGVSAGGASVSASQPVCPSQLRPNLVEPNHIFHTIWEGRENQPTSAEAVDVVKIKNNTVSGLVFGFVVGYYRKCSGLTCIFG